MAFRERDPRLVRAAVICLLLALGCLALIFAGCASSTLGKSLNVGIGVSAAWDLVETSKAEARGGREANPIMGDRELQRWVIKGIGVGTVIGAAHMAERDGDHTWAHVMRAITIAINVGLAVHNAGVLR